ncbi:hypothetical protein FA15DRAFT_664252 [Coprinopsis marcescibilis]|uniref:Manganese/iron superoxide dismutase C-terminal domain-containing protein n=1 Tax=Coprinopsis marcescibilis TaxID=230819 RepID=A0A5C3L8G8_COPMA|nr:hypothetical protein FA15DRAFT_664252 [Coprinopsis marcescibilis]
MVSGIPARLLSSAAKRGASIPRSRWFSIRKLHQRRGLLYNPEHGLGQFLPPPALRTAIDWQDGLLDRLNEEVKGTSEENLSVTQTVLNLSGYRERTLAFNYASLALNNSFFLDHLKPPSEESETHEKEMSSELFSAIETHHGSLSQLKSSFSAAAMGMFTNGWVWFVSDQRGITGILPTFGPGTLLVRSRKHMASGERGLIFGDSMRDGLESSPPDAPSESDVLPSDVTPPTSPTPKTQPPGTWPSSPVSGVSTSTLPPTPNPLGPRFIHTSRVLRDVDPSSKSTLFGVANRDTSPGDAATIKTVGQVLFPLFCVPVYEHSWMSAGYGVWGKEEWLKQLWSVIDWEKVSQSYNVARASQANFRG